MFAYLCFNKKQRAMTAIEFNTQLISFRPVLKRYAYTLTSDQDDALDLLQETYLRALSNREKFLDATNLKAWLYMIMKNIFINSYRRTVKAREIMQNKRDYSIAEQQASYHKNGSDSQLAEKEIKSHIAKLGEEYRIPFTRFYDGFKYKEIADEMNLPIGTVKSRIFIARKKLMDALKDMQN